MFCRPPRCPSRHSVRSNTKDGDSPNYFTELHTIDALVSSRRIEWQGLRPRLGECFYISTNSQNRKRKVARLGHKMSDFCDLRTFGSLAPKKRMENLQMPNSQIAIAEIWDTPNSTIDTLYGRYGRRW
jgi:hypothetical protein